MEQLSHNIEDYPEGIILPIDKPYHWTSADVIRKVKYAAIKHFGKKNLKVGHAGTLDPLATGILLVCIGPATKRAEELQRSRKRYLAGVSFGATTPSYDLEKGLDSEYPLDGVSEDTVRAILPQFAGEQEQIAPLFSAKSVDGVRMYEKARKLWKQGLPVESDGILQANRITVYDISLKSFALWPATPSNADTLCTKTAVFAHDTSENDPSVHKKGPFCAQEPFADDGKGRIRVADLGGRQFPTAMIDVECSKGTYIRALARDLGEALGSGAFLSSLRRTGNGGFGIEDAISLEEALELFAQQ